MRCTITFSIADNIFRNRTHQKYIHEMNVVGLSPTITSNRDIENLPQKMKKAKEIPSIFVTHL